MLFFVRRLAGLAVVLLAMTFVTFMLQQIVPGDPARAAVGPNAPPAVVQAKRAELQLDRPVLARYALYLSRLAQGDLGTSIRTHNPVADDLGRLLPATLELVGTAVVLGFCFGAALGLAGNSGLWSTTSRFVLLTGASAPVFLTAMLLALLFWFDLGWLPGSGRSTIADLTHGPTGLFTLDALLAGRPDILLDATRHLLLPAFTLALPMAVAIGRTLRSSLQGVMRQDYVRTARAKGLTDMRIVLRHCLRNAAQSPLAMAGLQIGLVLANVVIVERIYAWPGLGLYVVQATSSSDLPAVLGVAIVFASIYIVANGLIDAVQLVLDPRIGHKR